MKNKIVIFLYLILCIGELQAAESKQKKSKKNSIDFDLLMGTRQRDVMQAATHDTEYISIFYKSGPYLIFDCEKGNYACVHKDGYKFCSSLRKRSLEHKYKILSCAPLKKFDRFEYCIEKQKELVDYPVKKYFCLASQALKGIIFKKNSIEESH